MEGTAMPATTRLMRILFRKQPPCPVGGRESRLQSNVPSRLVAVAWCVVCCCVATCPAGENPSSKLDQVQEPVALNPEKSVLLDRQDKKLILETEVVFRAGLLEMLVCLKQTKEHESILSLNAKASTVHAGLLALGAETGTPVKFLPEFQPPRGQKIEIWLMWKNPDGKWERTKAQNWIREATRKYHVASLERLPPGLNIPEDSNLRHDDKFGELLWFGIMSEPERDKLLSWSGDDQFQKAVKQLFEISQIHPMTAEWVFSGSGFFEDEETGQRHYLAESGDLICVANFASATIDVKEESSADSQGGLSYEAWEERIPPLGTKVRVELIPVQPDETTDEPTREGNSNESTAPDRKEQSPE
jgi:hypothetical protein